MYHPQGGATISVKPPLPTTLLLPAGSGPMTTPPAMQSATASNTGRIAAKTVQPAILSPTPTPYVSTLITGPTSTNTAAIHSPNSPVTLPANTKQPILSKKASALVDNQLTSIIRSKASAMGLIRSESPSGSSQASTPTSTSTEQPQSAEKRDGKSPDIICLD